MMLTKQTEKMIDYLKNVVGERYVSINTFEKIKSCIDPFPYRINNDILPYVITLPENKEQVSKILKYANSEKIPVFIRGSGTSLAGSSRPHVSGIVINTRRMNKVHIYEDCGYFECEPGIRCGEMEDILNKQGYFLPVWPGSKVIASMGGVISNNTSGHIVDMSIGKPADYVLGLEVVLPNGEIIETGTKGLRKPAGTDLTRYFVGGDGLLGVIVNIRMRLVPALKEAYGIAFFENLEAVAKSVQRIYMEKCPAPLFMEFMSKEAAEIGFKIKKLDPPPGPAVFAVSIGNTQEEAQYKMEKIMDSLKKEKPIRAYQVFDKEEWHKLVSAREVIGPYAMQNSKRQLIVSEIVANLSQLVEAMRDAQDFNKDLPILKDCPNLLYGHIGGLTIHSAYLLPPEWDDNKLKAAVDELFKKEAYINSKYSTCGGEWGQFSKRTYFFKKRYGETSYNLIKQIKSVFDPNNILNPGVLEGQR